MKEELIYNFILENELTTQEALDLACSVGGYSEETLNYIIYYSTGYHDIKQLWECEKECFYFNDDVIKEFELKEKETTNYCHFVNDTVFCNGNCSKCGNSKQ